MWSERDRRLHINVKEMLALASGMSHITTGETVQAVMDNTSCLAVLRRTVSRSFALNGALLQVLSRLRQRHAVLASSTFVPSARNPADALSRRSSFDPESENYRGVGGLGRHSRENREGAPKSP